jgi:hypothetical protein
MPSEDLPRLRHFAITTGLALLTYAAAGISIDPKLSTFGVQIQIQRPELLPIGLALVSAYATLRFYYYAMMLGTSPHRVRRDILDSLHPDDTPPRFHTPMYFGARKFTTSPRHRDHDLVEKQAERICGAFPKFARGRVIAKPTFIDSSDENGEYTSWAVDCHIPVRCRIACIVEDFDYTIPVWLNLAGLTWFGWQVLR